MLNFYEGKIEACPFCGSGASVTIIPDEDEWKGTIAVVCDDIDCGGRYYGAEHILSGRSKEDFTQEEVDEVVIGWSCRVRKEN